MADSNNNGSKQQNDTNGDQEADMTISFVAALFDDVDAAKQAYSALKDVEREGLVKIIDAAYMQKTDRSKIKVYEHKDWRGGQGALAGGAIGAVIGIVGGAILLPAGIGALIGGIWAKVHDTGFNDKSLGKLADSLPAGTSALVAIVEDDEVEPVEAEMTKEGGKKVHSGKVPKSTADTLSEAKIASA
jgi:uncharacterized membrane protein